ncbi:MAG: endopeptidase La [Bacteroidetes Order II. Incertae sedis bacterium]|nr:endopeptidase La [Bacteroidetes Order II. bacterium]
MLPFYMQSDDDFDHAIPLLTADEEKKLNAEQLPDALPILALKNTVLYPGVVLPITVGRDTSLKLVREAYNGTKKIGVIAQKDSEVEVPTAQDLYEIGTVASILKLIKMPDGTVSIVIQGKRRFEIREYLQEEPYLVANVTAYDEPKEENQIELTARVRSIKDLATQIIRLNPNLPSEAEYAIQNIDSASFLIYFIASNLQIEVEKKQAILETKTLIARADLLLEHLEHELQVLELSEEIRSRVKTDVDKQQREYILRQQMKAIQDELGDSEFGNGDELNELRNKLSEKALPEHVRKAVDKEIDKLARTNPMSPDYSVIRNYVEWIADLPWDHYTEDHLQIKAAEDVLNEDHYGLEQVKKRILEYLAVLKLKGDMKAPILCFYGPPGVGKTSLGKSIARALGRKFVRISLGGVRDEAEIRGHRRTYIGALPGRIIQGLKKAGTSNPVFILDEIDKVGNDFRGDPSSALLEVLDPEQNNTFSDHYLELEYDLSKVMFIATANSLSTIPGPLRDRMEIIEINGYTLDEKLAISKQYLVPRRLTENGVDNAQFTIDDDALAHLIDGYTRESGVRQLERTIGSVVRGVAKKIAMEEVTQEHVAANDIEKYLGPVKFESDLAERTGVPGVATGLAWTPVGGDILFIEASVHRGNGRLIVTGQLGEVMKESASAALSWVKAHAESLEIPLDAFRYWDLHIHVPAGAVPKDGPSAGNAMISAITSIFTQRRIKHTVAMTGEITLRGAVLPVGGIKEKVLAAKRAGIETIIMPERNRKDLNEINKEALTGLKFHFVKRIDEVVKLVLEKRPVTDPAEKFRLPENEKPSTTASSTEVPIIVPPAQA